MDIIRQGKHNGTSNEDISVLVCDSARVSESTKLIKHSRQLMSCRPLKRLGEGLQIFMNMVVHVIRSLGIYPLYSTHLRLWNDHNWESIILFLPIFKALKCASDQVLG